MVRGVSGVALAIALVSALALPAQADTPSPAKSAATLTVVYDIKGAGKFTSNDKVFERTWRVTDSYTLRAKVIAQAASGFPALFAMDAQQQSVEAGRNAAAASAAANMAPMMAGAMAIMEKCGDDEECMEREAMKMAQGVDMNSAAMQNARSSIATASTMPKDRYQLFAPDSMTGEFKVDENELLLDRDPICHNRPAATCTRETIVVGGGQLTFENKVTMPGTTTMELDLEKNMLKFALPLPFPITVTETVKTDKPTDESYTKQEYRFLTDQKLDLNVEHKCGTSCKTVSGTKEWTIKDQLSGDTAKMTATWTFKRS